MSHAIYFGIPQLKNNLCRIILIYRCNLSDVRFIKIRTTLNSVLLLCLVQICMKQTLLR